MQPVIPKLKYCEDPDNETDRLLFLEFNKLKLIDTVLLIWDKQLYQSSQFDKQAICEVLKKGLSRWNLQKLCFASLVVKITAAMSFTASSFSQITVNTQTPQVLTSHFRKYSSIYRLIFIRTAPTCSLLLRKPSTSLQTLASCTTWRNKDC